MNTEVKDIILFPNGNCGVFDVAGQQISELQSKGWMEVYFEWLESKGVDPASVWIEAQLNNGVWKRVMPFKTEYGWNVNFGEAKII